MPVTVVTMPFDQAKKMILASVKDEHTWSIAEICARCGVSKPTVRKWIKSGELKAVRPLAGGRIYITDADLRDFERRHYVVAETPEKDATRG